MTQPTTITHSNRTTTVAPLPTDPAQPLVGEARRTQQASAPALNQIEPMPETHRPLSRLSEVPSNAAAVEAVATDSGIVSNASRSVFDLAAAEPKRSLMDMIDHLYILLLQANHRFSEHNRSKEDKEKARYEGYTDVITSNTKKQSFAKMFIEGLKFTAMVGGGAYVNKLHGNNADTPARKQDDQLFQQLAIAIPQLTDYFPQLFAANANIASSKQNLSSTKLQKMMNDDSQFKTMVDQIRNLHREVQQLHKDAAAQR